MRSLASHRPQNALDCFPKGNNQALRACMVSFTPLKRRNTTLCPVRARGNRSQVMGNNVGSVPFYAPKGKQVALKSKIRATNYCFFQIKDLNQPSSFVFTM